jgi:nucleolin
LGNVHDTVTEPDIRRLFEGCGTIERVKWLTDRATGRFKGSGFIEFSDEAGAVKAVNFNGAIVAGQILRVDYAGDKDHTASHHHHHQQQHQHQQHHQQQQQQPSLQQQYNQYLPQQQQQPMGQQQQTPSLVGMGGVGAPSQYDPSGGSSSTASLSAGLASLLGSGALASLMQQQQQPAASAVQPQQQQQQHQHMGMPPTGSFNPYQ